MNVNVQEILNLLSPATGLPYSIFLYLIFFLAFASLLLMPDKNMIPTVLTALVLLAVVVGKLTISAPNGRSFVTQDSFAILIANVAMMLFPFLTAGTVRTKARRNPVLPLSILTGIIGAVYFFVYGLFVMRWFFG